MSNVEQPNYNLIKKTKNIEIRHYENLLYAETSVTGPREESISTGFRIIADYIFGNNRLSESDDNSSKIAMTSPVIQERISNSSWKVKFIMPQSFTVQNLPLPNNEKIEIYEGNDEFYVTIRFSGSSSQKNLDKNHKILLDHISENDIETLDNVLDDVVSSWIKYCYSCASQMKVLKKAKNEKKARAETMKFHSFVRKSSLTCRREQQSQQPT